MSIRTRELATYTLPDLTTLGRQQEGEPMQGTVRHHDRCQRRACAGKFQLSV
jgi:hypothetical protein